jgi:hypothetical protein
MNSDLKKINALERHKKKFCLEKILFNFEDFKNSRMPPEDVEKPS